MKLKAFPDEGDIIKSEQTAMSRKVSHEYLSSKPNQAQAGSRQLPIAGPGICSTRWPGLLLRDSGRSFQRFAESAR